MNKSEECEERTAEREESEGRGKCGTPRYRSDYVGEKIPQKVYICLDNNLLII